VKASIAVLPGDGIGPEVIGQATNVLQAVAAHFGHTFELQEAPFGGSGIDAKGAPLPDDTLALCLASDAVLLGAVGGPKWDGGKLRPEAGLLGLRKALNVFANLRPVMASPALAHASTLRPEVLAGVDLVIVRELTGGIYFGEKRREGDTATDVCTYSVGEIERLVRVGARLAASRRGKLCSVDKANVLETSRLWREVTTRVVKAEFPQLQLSHQLVDSCAMQLVRAPAQFDVMVMDNLFGDILSDEAAMIAGSIGMLPSASLGEGTRGLYEPIHGSAPDIAGKGLANPFGTILSAAMLLRMTLGLEQEARAIEAAVAAAVEQGAVTQDLCAQGKKGVSTQQAGDAVVAAVRAARAAPTGA
jgi:3-isopropylmalate dehydrogenase